MSTSITTIQSTDLITNSRADINNNFDSLLVNKMETSVLDTDTTLAANSDSKVATQKAVKAYVDAGGNVNAGEANKGIVEEATDAEVTAGTATGGTGAKLFVTPAKLATRIATVNAGLTTVTTVASDTLRHSNDTTVSGSGNTLTLRHEITLGRPLASFRVKFSIVSLSGSTTDYLLKKNGVTVSSGGPSASGTAWSVDLADFTTGDTLQLWTARSGSGSTAVDTSNFRLYYDDIITGINSLTLSTPLIYDGSGLATHTNTLP